MEEPGLIIACVGLITLIVWGVPVGVALGLSGMGGMLVLTGSPKAALWLASLVAIDVTTTYVFMVIPLFILMGLLAKSIGISRELFDAAYKNLGRLPGGLAIATTMACAGFGTITGSSLSATVVMGEMALPEMKKFNYNPELSTGVIASSGTFAMMIPPSIMLVVFAMFAEQSIAKLLLAGAIPGLITAVVYALQILARVCLNPSLAPPAVVAFPWKEKIVSLGSVIPFLLVILAILMGILFGVWTPTEAASAGVAVVLIMGLIRRRLRREPLLDGVREAVVTTGSVFVLVIGCLIFSTFLAATGVSEQLVSSIAGLGLSSFGLFLLLMFFYIFLGCFLEGISMLALTVPLLLPIILSLGWNPIWFGIILVKLIEIAQVTPPVGLNLYAMKSVAPDVAMGTIYKGCIPFWLCDVGVLVLLYFFPQIPLWLPGLAIE